MTKTKSLLTKFASTIAFFFSAVLCVNANTASSGFIYQPKAPAGLNRFSKIR
mgnify:CR=1 FL=1